MWKVHGIKEGAHLKPIFSLQDHTSRPIIPYSDGLDLASGAEIGFFPWTSLLRMGYVSGHQFVRDMMEFGCVG